VNFARRNGDASKRPALPPLAPSTIGIRPMGFPNGEHITVLELLNHTSGVKNYTSSAAWREGAVDKDLSTAQTIAIFRDAKADFAPGSDWSYSNSCYVLAGAVIEAASGQRWYD
jgi:CubicO group peptidase (beta-lactamase class C family)